MSRTFNKNVILFLFIFLILAGKCVRYTIMKQTLVNTGIGHSMISSVASRKISFGLTYNLSNTEDTVEASDNATSSFSLINIFGFTTYESMEVYISIIWNLILLILIFKVKDSLSIFEFCFLALSIAVLNIFDFCLAKEPIQMLYFILIYYVLNKCNRTKSKYLFTIFVIFLSAITFRIYYFLIIIFMIFATVLFKKCFSKIGKVRIKHIILILLSIYILYFVLLNVAKIIAVDEYNELLRVRLRTSSAASDMRAIFKSSNLFIFCIDYIIMIIRMLLPVELLRLGPKYILYVIYQFMISFILVKTIANYKNISNTRKIALYLMIGFIMASAAFEPDFGSWVRHEAVTFPILLILSDIQKESNYDR